MALNIQLNPIMAFTFFFRDAQTLSLAIDHFLPFVQSRQTITIWSAGCAMGQEPYTFAILLRERMGPHLFRNVKIFATDIDIYNQYTDNRNRQISRKRSSANSSGNISTVSSDQILRIRICLCY